MFRIVLICFFFIASQAFAKENPVHILTYGDSLMAGYNLQEGEDFASQLETYFLQEERNIIVTNASVSGETTTGGVARLDWTFSENQDFDIVILGLGANDMLRALPPAQTKENLQTMIDMFLEKGADHVLLAGMKAAPNLGSLYQESFDGLYETLAAENERVSLYPFFLEGVATVPELNLADGIHPTAEGVSVIVENIVPYIERLLQPLK